MTPTEYRTALTTLGLSQLAAGRWLGVSPKTAQRYATDGPSGPAARVVAMAVALVSLQRFDDFGGWCSDGQWVRHSDLNEVMGLL